VFELGDGEPYEPWCENWHAVMEALLKGEVAPKAINKDLRTGRYGSKPDEQMVDIDSAKYDMADDYGFVSAWKRDGSPGLH
jgi:hypothetical protein